MPDTSTRQDIEALHRLLDDVEAHIAEIDRQAEELLRHGGTGQDCRNATAHLQTLRDAHQRMGDLVQQAAKARNTLVAGLYAHSAAKTEELAECAGVNSSYVSRAARGRGVPPRTVREGTVPIAGA